MSNSTPSSPLDIPATTVGAHCFTPQQGFIAPLTPPTTEDKFPQAERILALFKDIQSGCRRLCGEQEYIQFQLVDGEFDEILRRLEGDPDLEGYVNDKIRIGLDTAADVDSAQALHTPDIPLRYERDPLPGGIIEVAYTQSSKNLRRLAYTYLVHSLAAVKVVYGFRLKDGPGQRATFSVWCSKVEDEMVCMKTPYYNQEFRSSIGEPTTHSPLLFRLQDLAVGNTAKELLGDDDEKLYITMEQLCSFLSEAEKKLENRKKENFDMTMALGKRKQPYEETPERTMTAEEEEEWELEETRAAKRANRGDYTYSGPHRLSTGLTLRKSARLEDASQETQ
ncbi:hypothetical protein ACEQ8H_004572 [Pleosporales sp. CAS-2024a]